MDHRERARALFLEGYNCCQSVFGAFTDVTDFDFETSMRLASSFGAGMGRMREGLRRLFPPCFFVVGIVSGYSDPADREAKANHYALLQLLAGEFREKNHTILCRELLAGIRTDTRPVPDPRTAEYYKIRPCGRFVEDAAEILDNYLTNLGK